jgi:hypothetical protein
MQRKKGRQAYWLIEGYDSTTKIFEKRIEAGQITEQQAMDMLKALVAKAGLTFDEIVGAYARRRSTIANDHLLVQRDGPHCVFYCGGNPHFEVSLRDSDGQIPIRKMRA